MKIEGKLVDIHRRVIYPAVLTIRGGVIEKIERTENVPDRLICPGLIDAHIHIESSMITPGAFAMEAVRHGTIEVVSDPHEIANVMGIDGVKYMIRDARQVPLRFTFGVPSCVPATGSETNGAEITADDIEKLFNDEGLEYLSEMMNFPGVVYSDKEVMKKLDIAKRLGKPIDGHAPGLSGEMLEKYVEAGISTDHECSNPEEAKEKIRLGMKILMREGSAARNLDALKELYSTDPQMLMLCSDDLHPEMLFKGHINRLVAKLIKEGYDMFDVLRSATINPVLHYNLKAGLLRKDDRADFIIVDSLYEMNVRETWIDGEKVYGEGKVYFDYKPLAGINNFRCTPLVEKDIEVRNSGRGMRVIEAYDGELITGELTVTVPGRRIVESDISGDILKIVVKDRYKDNPPAVGFIKGFGIEKGAFASSVAHDSHNIIAVGTDDRDIVKVINKIILLRGGLAVSDGSVVNSLQLDIGGIMTTRKCSEVKDDYESLNEIVKSLGCRMKAPFMTLSFMALLVIPDLKIGDKGLFDVKQFQPVALFVD
jgi:adenine deaminase